MKVSKTIRSFVSENLGSAYSVSFVGEKEGESCYCASVANSKTGFPVALVLSSNGEITEFKGFIALDVISAFKEN